MSTCPRPGSGRGQLGYFSGKPWAAAAQVNLPQNNLQRVLIETRGSRRLSSQALLDLRVSRPIQLGRLGRIDLLVDVLNVLNDTSEEGLATDILMTETVKQNPDFGRPNAFVDPRRVMLGARLALGHERRPRSAARHAGFELVEPIEDDIDLGIGPANELLLPRRDQADQPTVPRDIVVGSLDRAGR